MNNQLTQKFNPPHGIHVRVRMYTIKKKPHKYIYDIIANYNQV